MKFSSVKGLKESLAGCLLGQAVGDSLGLPCEGLSPDRIAVLFPLPLRQRLVFGRGMVSDDTEHAALTALAYHESKGSPTEFGIALARNLRWWLAAFPGGVGYATLRALCKSWLGWSPASSGVLSAGNGPAMRGTVLGVLAGEDFEAMKELVKVSTRLTHLDPRAEVGALAVAWAARNSRLTFGLGLSPGLSPRLSPEAANAELTELLSPLQAGSELLELIRRAAESAFKKESAAEFAAAIGSRRGVSGFMFHTVPVVFQVLFAYPGDLKGALTAIISAGGDADTTGAILGGIMGAGLGSDGIPKEWVDRLVDWPWNPASLERLAAAIANKLPTVGVPFWGFQLARNLFFLAVILTHGLRRLAPPY